MMYMNVCKVPPAQYMLRKLTKTMFIQGNVCGFSLSCFRVDIQEILPNKKLLKCKHKSTC